MYIRLELRLSSEFYVLLFIIIIIFFFFFVRTVYVASIFRLILVFLFFSFFPAKRSEFSVIRKRSFEHLKIPILFNENIFSE